ncbi:MAG TPA: phage baseplate assembly protein V [Verrucomicrobiae bacterium]|nr:phage baseplate assembly protein V [Verrucomicrobiae bacterium]
MKHVPGVVTAIVKNLADPEGQGRIELQFPWLSDSLRSSWAPVAAPLAGRQRGMFFMPELDDEVLVAFDHGDFDHPYIVGYLWNGVDTPPESDLKNRVLVTPGGHTLRFEDRDGAKKVILKSSSGQTITLDDSDGSITLEGGQRVLKMSNGVVQIL